MADILATDRLDPGLIARFRATLGPWLAPMPEWVAPLGAHWCLFPPLAAMAELGLDGHPPRLHPISEADFPRRMWVGGELHFEAAFPVDRPIRRTTEIGEVTPKSGSSGRLMFAGLEHGYLDGASLLCRERQDLVYRPGLQNAPAAAHEATRLAVTPAELAWEIETSETLLFRYSALTFNAHRIHYDRDYARGMEGHPDILVHGPLQATWLLNAAAMLLGLAPARFRYRALRPLPAGSVALVTARIGLSGVDCHVHDALGRPTMEGKADAG